MKSIFAAILILFACSALPAMGQPAPFQRNPWTTNVLPQVNRGYGITIQTNAGHKLVINVDPPALTNAVYWTNIAGLLRTIGSGVYTNFWVDTNVAAMTIGSILSVNPTNGRVLIGPGVMAGQIGTGSGTVAIGDDALAGGLVNSESAIVIGQGAMQNVTASSDYLIAIGPSTGQGFVFSGSDVILLGHLATASGVFSNRVSIGVGAHSDKGNQMVLGRDITNYVLRNVEYTFPSAQGASGTVLSNNGSGNLTWATPTPPLPTILTNLLVSRSPPVVTNLDWAASGHYDLTNTASSVIQFSNAFAASTLPEISVVVSNAGSFTITWHKGDGKGVHWGDNTTNSPTIPANKTVVFGFMRVGTNIVGAVNTNLQYGLPAFR